MAGSSQQRTWTTMAGHTTVLWFEKEPGGTGRAATPISTECIISLPVLRIKLGFIGIIGKVMTP